jgi:hypothetical protein
MPNAVSCLYDKYYIQSLKITAVSAEGQDMELRISLTMWHVEGIKERKR